jgi:hypothetical protein
MMPPKASTNDLFTMRYKRYSDRETLERLKRWPQLMGRFPKVRIYSAQWSAYWRGTGNGYTEHPEASHVWDIQEAFEQTRHCGPEKLIQFRMVNTPDSGA